MNNINQAIQHHTAGRLEEAEKLYREILTLEPGHADALHLLGVIAHQRRQHELAVTYISRAIALYQSAPAYHNNLGEAYRSLGSLDKAVASYRQALVLDARFVDAHYNLGNVLQTQGAFPDALACYRTVLRLNPGHAKAGNNMGNALKALGRLEEAIVCYREALAISPNMLEAHNNLGIALQVQGQLAEAISSHRKALDINPMSAECHNNLGNALQDQGQWPEAVACYRQALALNPNFVEAYYNLGNALYDHGQLNESVIAYRQALALNPDYADVHNSLGIALKDMGKFEDSIGCYRQAMACRQAFAAAHSNLLFTLSYYVEDPNRIAQEYQQWNNAYAQPLAPVLRSYENKPDPERRLRLGYVSADFRGHATSFFIEPLLRAHDRTTVELFCYSNLICPDDKTGRFEDVADCWRHVAGITDEDVAQRIAADKIDILIDLSGHTARNRLLVFARKPAPVQVTYLGSITTTGLTTVDYQLTDGFLHPTDSQEWLSEEPIRLPACFVCYQPPVEAPPVTTLPAATNGYITFGSFNNLAKVTPAVVDLWSQLLHGVPDARLLLKDRTLTDSSQRARYLELFKSHGVKPERIELLTKTSHADYLATYGRVDIGLDPFPCNGCSTTCASLWMGVPVITLAGAMSYSRYGVSLLASVGLEHCIAPVQEAYMAKAVALAGDLTYLAELRSKLRPMMASSSLCDHTAFARSVESAYRMMWRRWCEAL